MHSGKTSADGEPAGLKLRVLWFHTAVGRGCLTYSADPFFIYDIALPGTRRRFRPGSKDGTEADHPSAVCVGRIIADYFCGRRPAAVPESWLALDRLTPGERAVLKIVRRIPYGATRTYAEVAELAGFPRGARFAGNALHKNPFPVIIPCHRVVRSDGTIGGFASGCQMKEKMIALEETVIKRGRGAP